MTGIGITLGLLAIAAIAAIVAGGLQFNTTYIPGPIDANTLIENAITKTADFDGTTFDFGAGYAPGGPGQAMAAVIQATALDLTTTDETYAFIIQESADNATWVTISASVALTAVGAKAIPVFISQRYVRAKLDVGGTTPSITYSAWMVPIQ